MCTNQEYIFPTTDQLLIGFDFSEDKDVTVLVVGRPHGNESLDLINAFSGRAAEDLYKLLVGGKNK